MGYLKIQNLYKSQEILMFKECYALEKVHGSSCHIAWKDGTIRFSSGGLQHPEFVKLFDADFIKEKFEELGHPEVVIFGEGYGGKCQKMSHTYGKETKFVVFDIKIGHSWLSVPQMDDMAKNHFGLDVVDWVKIPTDLDRIDAERDKPSVQAIKNGCGDDKLREGIVLRPPIEVKKNNGERIIAKHKGDDFQERNNQPKVKEVDPDKLKVLTEAKEIADEWATEMRLSHVLDKLGDAGIENTKDVILAMIEDIEREAEGEILSSKAVRKAIGKAAAQMFKQRLQDSLKE